MAPDGYIGTMLTLRPQVMHVAWSTRVRWDMGRGGTHLLAWPPGRQCRDRHQIRWKTVLTRTSCAGTWESFICIVITRSSSPVDQTSHTE
jgi:hypothetical protein